MTRVLNLLYGDASPYDGHDVDAHPRDVQGWNSDSHVFRDLIEQVRPRLILEVGTWKGASAIYMGHVARQLGLDDLEIVCVDTWLGSHDMFQREDLRRLCGYPRVYYTFLTNVIAAGLDEVITPLPATSEAASMILSQADVVADLVYIDADHAYSSIYHDLHFYWPLVRPGGVMFGDDYDESHPGVRAAVQDFWGRSWAVIQTVDSKFIIRK